MLIYTKFYIVSTNFIQYRKPNRRGNTGIVPFYGKTHTSLLEEKKKLVNMFELNLWFRKSTNGQNHTYIYINKFLTEF